MKSSLKKLMLCGLGVFIVMFSQLAVPKLFDVVIDKRFGIVTIAVILCLMLVDFKNRQALARNAFLIIAILGTAIGLIKPVQYSLDEDSHLVHTIGLSDSLVFKYSKETFSDYEQVFKHDYLRNTDNYQGDKYWFNAEHKPTKVKGQVIGFDNPAFLPGTIGWNLGRLLSDKVYVSYYLGRIVNVLTYALLVFIALKISLVYQPILFLMGVLPSAIHVIAGFHYDYLYYGASLIVIALLTNILSEKQKISAKLAMTFQFLTLLFAFAKFPFILVGSLFLVLPQKYYVSKGTRLLSGIMFLAMMLVSLLYTGIIKVIPVVSEVTGQSPGIIYFIKHPLSIIRTLFDIPYVVIDHFVAHPLQYVTHDSSFMMSMNIIVFVLLLFVASLQWKYQLPLFFQVYTGALLLGIASLMIFAITGDPRVYTPGDVLIRGVQGRYYYFMITLVPIFLGDWVNCYFDIKPFATIEETRFVSVMQYALVFLNILTLSVGLYTQL